MSGPSVFKLCCVAACSWAAIGTTTLVAQTASDAESLKSPEDGGPRRWEISGGTANLFAGPSATARVIGDVPEGSILSNLGCATNAGQHWCEVRPLRGGARAFVKAARIRPAKGPDGSVPVGVNDSPHRARSGDFDDTGGFPCAQERGQTLGICRADVSRSDGGDATVVVTFPNGFVRRLFFVHGEFRAGDATMSGVGTDVDWHLEGGVHYMRVDDQRYELTDSFVFGD